MTQLRVPNSGFSEWLLYRASYSDSYELLLCDAPVAALLNAALTRSSSRFSDLVRSYEIESAIELKYWLLNQNLPLEFVEKLVDMSTNWRLLHFKVADKSVHIPEYQDHPLEPVSHAAPFMANRPTKPADRFDPLLEIIARRKL